MTFICKDEFYLNGLENLWMQAFSVALFESYSTADKFLDGLKKTNFS